MTPTKTTFLQFTCTVVLLCSGGAIADAPADQDFWLDDDDDEFEVAVDGMAMPPIAEAIAPPRLVGPQLAAHHVLLPPTVMPEAERRRWHLRAADLNGDGVIDALDLHEMIERFGPCPQDEVCPDFNGDGIVDEQDFLKMLEYLGTVVSTNDATSRVQIGYIETAPAVARGPLARFPLDGERLISRLELTSPDAGGLRLEIENMFSGSVEVRVYDPNGATVLGPYFADRADEEGRFWTPTIFGPTIGIELVFDEQAAGMLAPAISRIAYIYAGGECTDCAGGPGTPLACHNCIACSSSWQNADGRAVGQMSWLSGGGCFRCTGALLNRGPGDFSPLFMTANHCISTQAEANTLEVRWLYETSTCNPCGGVPGFNNVPRNNGSRLLKRRSSVDWTLLGLYDPPNITGGAYFLGWLSSNWTSGQSATGIHHPRTSHKRISFGTSGGTVNGALFCDPNGPITCNCPNHNNRCIEVDVRNVDYTSGTTEPGSSGSPIFDPNRRVRGTLTGGPGGCAPVVARYGRFDLAYTNLRYFLGSESIASPTVYVLNWSGDPGNNGNLERGTPANPFNSVHEASYAVIAGEEVSISPGNYNQSMRIWRPMTITRWGSSGSVVIGAP